MIQTPNRDQRQRHSYKVGRNTVSHANRSGKQIQECEAKHRSARKLVVHTVRQDTNTAGRLVTGTEDKLAQETRSMKTKYTWRGKGNLVHLQRKARRAEELIQGKTQEIAQEFDISFTQKVHIRIFVISHNNSSINNNDNKTIKVPSR